MTNLNTAKARASASASDSDIALPDGDSPSRLPCYQVWVKQIHRYVARYTDSSFAPLLRPAFRAVPISPSADADQLKWGDWAGIVSYVSASKPLFLWSQ